MLAAAGIHREYTSLRGEVVRCRHRDRWRGDDLVDGAAAAPTLRLCGGGDCALCGRDCGARGEVNALPTVGEAVAALRGQAGGAVVSRDGAGGRGGVCRAPGSRARASVRP